MENTLAKDMIEGLEEVLKSLQVARTTPTVKELMDQEGLTPLEAVEKERELRIMPRWRN